MMNLIQSNPQQAAKKAEERKFLECLKSSYADFPVGVIADADPPDFIVRAAGGDIGVEITRYPYVRLNDDARKARRQEAEWDKAVQGAGAAYISRNLPPIDVGVIFNPHFDVTRNRRKMLENILLELVVNNLPNMGTVVSLPHQGIGNDPVPEEVQVITIARFDVLTRSHWAVQHGGWMKSLSPSEFLEILKEKEKKLPLYRQRVKEVWLCCVIEGLRPSSFVEVANALINETYTTNFHKVLLLEYFDKRVRELKLKPHLN